MLACKSSYLGITRLYNKTMVKDPKDPPDTSNLARWASSAILAETVLLLAAATSIFIHWSIKVLPVTHEGKTHACNTNTAGMRNWVLDRLEKEN
jgi:hypothetical protein